MAVMRLHNEDWGFETNCFVCEPRNASGLRIPFHYDDVRDEVTATFVLDDAFSGAPTVVHGGVSLAVLDEVQAWATIASAHRFAMTSTTSARFERMVLVGRTYTGVGRVTARNGTELVTSGEIRDHKDRICVRAEATFTVLSEAQAVRVVGSELDGTARSYTTDRSYTTARSYTTPDDDSQ